MPTLGGVSGEAENGGAHIGDQLQPFYFLTYQTHTHETPQNINLTCLPHYFLYRQKYSA
jgi:hypothetical protein